MFDANAAHIKEGEKFFVEVHSTDSILEAHGVKVGDILLCEHLEKDMENFPDYNQLSLLWTGGDTDRFEWTPKGEFSLMVYSGRPNGKGFICDKWKAKALDLIGGEWYANQEK